MKPVDKLKDFLYDSIDYIIMVGIVVVVILVVGWRLDILFTGSDVAEVPTNEVSEPIIVGENPNGTDDINPPETPNNDNTMATEVKVTIPDGSLPNEIGEILQESGVIEDSNEFVNKAVELGLDTKLKSGSYSFNTNQTIEEIILVIAKQASNY